MIHEKKGEWESDGETGLVKDTQAFGGIGL